MAAKENLTVMSNMSSVNPRAIDFVTRFGISWRALRDILGITREIAKVPGQTLKVLTGGVTLQNGTVGEGEEIPYSQATVTETPIAEATLSKWKKGVSIEAINKYGYDVAVEKTDQAFLTQLQRDVQSKMYTFLRTGTLTESYSTFQMALAMAKGQVLNKFEALGLESTEVVAFANYLDFYEYIGGAAITTQTAFGMTYVENFMGYRVIFLAGETDVPKGTVIATPVENMVCYYINPASSDFGAAGLEFTVDGETPLIGFHTEGNYSTLVSENTAIMGMYLFAEHLDGIAVITVGTGA